MARDGAEARAAHVSRTADLAHGGENNIAVKTKFNSKK
jgi:hypothetical protein